MPKIVDTSGTEARSTVTSAIASQSKPARQRVVARSTSVQMISRKGRAAAVDATRGHPAGASSVRSFLGGYGIPRARTWSCAQTPNAYGKWYRRIELELERAMGFEPTTSSLGSWHSTTELHPRTVLRPVNQALAPSRIITLRTASFKKPRGFSRPLIA